MSQYTLPFQQKEDLPEEDFLLFSQLNSSPRYWQNDWPHLSYDSDKDAFYELKDIILNGFGRTDGYDLQVIKRTCRHCDGTGRHCYWIKHLAERCWQCGGTGIYEKVQVALRRYILNEHLFHKPMGRISGGCFHAGESTIQLDFHEVIKGIVEHKPTPGVNYMEAFEKLCRKYSMPTWEKYDPTKQDKSLML